MTGPLKASARLRENPFFVLAVPVTATRIEVEREAHKLLGMLELGVGGAAWYASPLGWHARTADLVRAAAAALRDPRRRLVAEAWARDAHPVAGPPPPPDQAPVIDEPAVDEDDPPAPGWEDARGMLGWAAGAWRPA